MKEHASLNLVAYTRLSQANTHEGESHSGQYDRIVAWASTNGHSVIDHCSDTVGGANSLEDRPGFLVALDAIDEGKAAGIAVASLDRLARKLSTQEALLSTVWRREAVVFEVGLGEIPQDDPNDPHRAFLRQVMGAAAQLERSLIVKRMADGRRRAIRQGRSIGPAPSFGWTKDPDDPGRLLPDPGTFHLVQEAMRRLDAGTPLVEVASFLASATGRRWHPTQVARVRDRYGRYGLPRELVTR